jgi:hypothetical protein
MVKYLSFHNSSFALRFFSLCKWQGRRVKHPLFLYFIFSQDILRGTQPDITRNNQKMGAERKSTHQCTTKDG